MISVLKIDNSNQWDSLVKSFKNYDVMQLSNYAKAFSKSGYGEPILIYYENGDSRAINVIMKRDISNQLELSDKLEKDKWYDVSSVYGYGGFILEGDDFSTLEEEYLKFLKKEKIISEFVRFNLNSEYFKIFSGKIVSNSDNVIRELISEPEEILANYDRKVRKNLRRAEKSNLEFLIGSNKNSLNDFLEIYYETMDRNDANKSFYFSKSFFKEINKMEANFIYFFAKKEDAIISTELVLLDKETAYSFLGGTKKEFYEFRPNDFLKHNLIMHLKSIGIKLFILGGGYGSNDGIFKYKKCFAPDGIKKFYIGKRIIDKDSYNYLVKLSRNKVETDFFPAYRK